MNKKCYRFYGGLITSQENWLTKMADSGYKLIRTTKAMYEFAPCNPGQYQYRIEFVALKSQKSGQDYAHFLEECGYCVFFKNINLNYSIGKVNVRPWAEKGGRFAANSTTYNRELLIVEKEHDGKDFELHTTYEDKRDYCKDRRKPWLFLFFLSAMLSAVQRHMVWGIFTLIIFAVLIAFQKELVKLKKQNKIREW